VAAPRIACELVEHDASQEPGGGGTGAPWPASTGATGMSWHADKDRGGIVGGETFPGLGPTWIRVAVRNAGTSDRFAAALADALGRQFNI
jgi:hypothetical protein